MNNIWSQLSPDDFIAIRHFMREFCLTPSEEKIYALIYEVSHVGSKWELDCKTTADIAGCCEKTARASLKNLVEMELIREVDKYVPGDNTNCRHYVADMQMVEAARASWDKRMQEVAENPAKPAWTSDIETVEQDYAAAHSVDYQVISDGTVDRGVPVRPKAEKPNEQVEDKRGMTNKEYRALTKLIQITRNRRFLDKAREPFMALLAQGYTPEDIVEAWNNRQADASLTASDNSMYPSLWKWLSGNCKGLNAKDYLAQLSESKKEAEAEKATKKPKYKVMCLNPSMPGDYRYAVSGLSKSGVVPLRDEQGRIVTETIDNSTIDKYLKLMIDKGGINE